MVNLGNLIASPLPPADAIGDALFDVMGWFDRALRAESSFSGDPLVLDLNGNGVQLIDQQDSHAFFDIDDDGFAEKAGWVKAEDGILARDLNGNGTIDDVNEIFGTLTTPGLQILSQLDSNSDGWVDANDTDYSTLRIWRDLNEDGHTDSGELQTLAENDVSRISLLGQFDGRTLEGNLINNAATFEKISGGTAEMLEVFFTYNEFNTEFVGNGGLDAAIDPATLSLPLSRGYGSIPSLQVAMTQDATLKGMVEALGATPLTDYGQTRADVEAILLRWADVGTPANLSNFDEYRLAFLEKMTNQAFTKIQGSLVNPASVPFLQEAWETAMQTFSDRFLVQGMLGDIFPNASYDFATDSLHLGSSLADIVGNVHTSVLAHDYIFINDLGRILNTYPEDLGADTSEISIAVSNLLAEALLGEGGDYGLGALLANLHIDNVIDATQEGIASFISGQGNLLTTEGTFHNDRIIGSDETNIRDVIYGQDGDDLLIGNKGNDALYAYGGNDILVGGEGNDSLSSSGDGHDFLLGGDGNDDFTIKDSCTVVGGDGNDRVFGTSAVKNEQIFLGAGNDRINVTIQDSVAFLGGGNDTAAGAFNSQVFLEDGDDRVGIQNGGSSNPFYQLNSLLDAGSGNDIIYLSLLNQSTLIGGEGNDTLFGGGIVSYGQIYGGNGDDSVSAGGVQNPGVIQSTLSGGMGNDTVAAGDSAIRLEGNEGNDLIRHSGLSFVATLVGGTGNDTMISQDYRSHDTYLFYTEDGNDRMEYTPHNGSVALDSIFINDIHVSGEAQFYAQNIWRIAAAGTIFNLTLTGADLVLTEDGNLNDSITLANFDTVNGGYGITLGDPGLQLEGTSGNDTLIGSFAADVINGNGGADSIVGDDGDDTLTGGDNTSDDGQDTIYGGAGNDSILGGYHHDLLYGDDGDDIIDGGLHNDTINGGAGNDTLNGGISGADSLDGGLGDDLLLGGSNFDTLHGGDGNDSLDGGDADDTLYGDEGNDTLNGGISGADSLDGGLGDDLLLGGSNFDTLHGGGGNDSLDGGDADDTLYGDGGNDTLNGGSNNDTLTGGEDADMLIGGTGSDVFSFTTLNDSTSTSRDVIADFVKGQDKIDFSGITSITGIGNLSITLFENNTFITTGDGLDLCLNGNFTQGTNQLDAADFIF